MEHRHSLLLEPVGGKKNFGYGLLPTANTCRLLFFAWGIASCQIIPESYSNSPSDLKCLG